MIKRHHSRYLILNIDLFNTPELLKKGSYVLPVQFEFFAVLAFQVEVNSIGFLYPHLSEGVLYGLG